MTESHPDPGAESAARVAQLAAMTISVAEALARLRAQRLHDRAIADDRVAAAVRAQARTDRAAARLAWSPAMDDAWLRGASMSQLLDAWGATGPYADTDPPAGAARDRVESRLRQLHAEAMQVYDAGRAEGYPPTVCMGHASALFRGEYGLDAPGTPIHRSVADLERHRAAADTAMPDAAATPTVDEAGLAAADAARHAGTAAAVDARSLAAHAYPVQIEQAMRTAPSAAKAMLALPPAPQRKQLTAVRTPTQSSDPSRRTR